MVVVGGRWWRRRGRVKEERYVTVFFGTKLPLQSCGLLHHDSKHCLERKEQPCTNCGLLYHDSKHCLERPKKTPAKFLQNYQVQEPIPREVPAPRDDWDKYVVKKLEVEEFCKRSGGVRSFRCRNDIPAYLNRKSDKEKDEDLGDLTTHYDPRIRFNYRKTISSTNENFELGVQLCTTSWMDTEMSVGQAAMESVVEKPPVVDDAVVEALAEKPLVVDKTASSSEIRDAFNDKAQIDCSPNAENELDKAMADEAFCSLTDKISSTGRK